MKKHLIAIIGSVIVLSAASVKAQNSIPLPGISITNVSLSIDTNWTAIPFASYRMDNHEFGYGLAVLYQVSPYFWTGARVQTMGGVQTSAGVQGQLQVSETIGGVTLTPFVETSVGTGTSALWGSVGPGMYTKFHTWHFDSNKYAATVGLIGDFEHVVNGKQNYNEANAGLLINVSFP